MTKLHTAPTDKGEIAQLVSEIHPIIYPGSNAGEASPGTHWLSVSVSQPSYAGATWHFHTVSVTNPLFLGFLYFLWQ